MYIGNGTGGGWPSGGTQIGGGEDAFTFFGMLYSDNNTTEPDMIMRNNTPGPNLGHLELYKGTGTGNWTSAIRTSPPAGNHNTSHRLPRRYRYQGHCLPTPDPTQEPGVEIIDAKWGCKSV